MNSVQFAQRLLRYLTVKDLSSVAADDALGLLDAMNAGIQEYYSLVPDSFKRTVLSGELTPAQTVTATFTNGSRTFSGWTASPLQKAFTIVCGTDPRQNTIIGPQQLLDEYTGPTGTFTAQVYGDCLHMDTVLERFTNDPILVDFNVKCVRNEAWRQIAVTGPWPGSYYQYFVYGSYSTRQVRTPWQYWIEPQGQSQSGLPPFVLRFDSLPDQLYRVRIEGLLAPAQVLFDDLRIPKVLSIDSYLVESTVLPMAAYNLRTHPLWANSKLLGEVGKDYERARKMAINRIPDQGNAMNLVGTPRGY